MGWIQTYTGRKVDPLGMGPGDVCLEDIAHALAMKCRFTGHVPEFYSVAQHSVLVAQHCAAGVEVKRWALLHDAAEAYLADIARPVKQGFREAGSHLLDNVEASVMRAVCVYFALPIDEPHEVKAADNRLLTTEALVFFGHTNLYREWEHRPENGFPIVMPAVIKPLLPRDAKREFLCAASRLGIWA